MNPYRCNATPTIEQPVRWGVTKWKKMYVKVARIFFNLREKYSYQREYNQYLRDLADWQFRFGRRPNKLRYMDYAYLKIERVPPMPLPPPIRINE